MSRQERKLQLLSVVIPTRDEEGCIASTVEHLHLELDPQGVSHEIVVVSDGSTDKIWEILQQEAQQIAQIVAVNSPVLMVSGGRSSRGWLACGVMPWSS